MTARELIAWAGEYQLVVIIALSLIPLSTWLVRFLHRRGEGGEAPVKYLYALLVYLACVPGIFASMLTLYSLLLVRVNLLDVSPEIYFLPIVTMVSTLMLMARQVDFDDVPGFGRLTGLMVLLGLTFLILLALDKTRIFLIFHGGFLVLLAIAGGVFALLKWSGYMLFRRSDEARVEPPKLFD